MKSRPRYWLFKSEPDVFSIQDLERAEGQRTCWEGVRNYQARNSLRDDVRIGDQVLYYHSNAEPPQMAGVAEVVREAYPDHFALDEKSPYFDPKSTAEKPTWVMVDIALVEIFKRPIPLATLREVPSLAEMVLLQKGSRLSIQPVTPKEFAAVLKLARKP